MQELLEVGAIKLGEARPFGHGTCLRHQVDEVAPLELVGGLPLGLCEWLDRGFRSPRRAFANRRVIAALRSARKPNR